MIVDAGIDYLRLTVKPDGNHEEITGLFYALQRDRVNQGHETKSYNFQGYSGTRAENIAYGKREDGHIFEAQGYAANEAMILLKGVGFNGNITRLDAQITTTHQGEQRQTLDSLFNDFRMPQNEADEQRKRNLVFHRSRNKADTLYIGSRNSGAYICIYSASHVHRGRYPNKARRFEVRYRGDAARDRYTQAQIASSVTCCAASFVIGHCLSIGLNREWMKGEVPIEPFKFYKPVDNERRLAWIENYVAGTIKHLIRAGYGDRLANVLGVKSLELKEDTRQKSRLASPKVLGVAGLKEH